MAGKFNYILVIPQRKNYFLVAVSGYENQIMLTLSDALRTEKICMCAAKVEGWQQLAEVSCREIYKKNYRGNNAFSCGVRMHEHHCSLSYVTELCR